MDSVTQESRRTSAHPASSTPASVRAAAPETEPSSCTAEHSIESLLRLRAKIDEEVSQRFTQELCLMLADVVGSTQFYQKHGDVKGRLLVQRHNDTLFPLIHDLGGKVIKTIGDGIMASFATSGPALDCALAIQKKLWEMNRHASTEDVLHTKISLHFGQALVEANDIYGDLVNTSARLNSLTESDQILISQTVYDQVKSRSNLVLLPLEPVCPKAGEKSVALYEVLWLQHTEADGKDAIFRDFTGTYKTCFYCGLQEHLASNCPSKQLKGPGGRLERLGYLPTPDILRLLQQEDLNAASPPTDTHVYEAFYDVCLPYQLRFLPKLWLAEGDDWRKVERFNVPLTNPLAGTRLWLGMDCLRVGRYDQAKIFLDETLKNGTKDYKTYLVLGFWAMEQEKFSAALQYWRNSLTLTKTSLQEAYVRLLLHRLYAVNGKAELAKGELHRALVKHRYLHEAVYRQATLMSADNKPENIPTRLRQLIAEDRQVYLKVLLDPAFASLRTSIYPLLTTLFDEVKAQALERLQLIIEQVNTLRLWYRQPETELGRVERTLATMRQHIKSDSYFGYCDVIDTGVSLAEQLPKLLGQRKSDLLKQFVATFGSVHMQLQTFTGQTQAEARGAKLLSRLATIQRMPRKTVGQFWRAWDELEKLQTDVTGLRSGTDRHPFARDRRGRRALLLYALAGGLLADTALVGILGYLTYFSGLHLSGQQFLIILLSGALGGALVGSWLGWLWQHLKR
jgi:class 3 adenylate cyclase/tetratricopeptide (TPR) repeat protein